MTNNKHQRKAKAVSKKQQRLLDQREEQQDEIVLPQSEEEKEEEVEQQEEDKNEQQQDETTLGEETQEESTTDGPIAKARAGSRPREDPLARISRLLEAALQTAVDKPKKTSTVGSSGGAVTVVNNGDSVHVEAANKTISSKCVVVNQFNEILATGDFLQLLKAATLALARVQRNPSNAYIIVLPLVERLLGHWSTRYHKAISQVVSVILTRFAANEDAIKSTTLAKIVRLAKKNRGPGFEGNKQTPARRVYVLLSYTAFALAACAHEDSAFVASLFDLESEFEQIKYTEELQSLLRALYNSAPLARACLNGFSGVELQAKKGVQFVATASNVATVTGTQDFDHQLVAFIETVCSSSGTGLTIAKVLPNYKKTPSATIASSNNPVDRSLPPAESPVANPNRGRRSTRRDRNDQEVPPADSRHDNGISNNKIRALLDQGIDVVAWSTGDIPRAMDALFQERLRQLQARGILPTPANTGNANVDPNASVEPNVNANANAHAVALTANWQPPRFSNNNNSRQRSSDQRPHSQRRGSFSPNPRRNSSSPYRGGGGGNGRNSRNGRY